MTRDSDLRRKTALGVAWMVGLKLCQRSLGLISTIILARILAPADFGIIALATAIVGVLELITVFGFDIALIQRQDTERRHYDTAWTLNGLLASMTTGLLWLASIPVSAFYDEARLRAIICVLSLGVLLRGWENIGIVDFRKRLEFNREFWFQTNIKLIAFFVTLTLAVALRSYWALVCGVLASRISGFVLSYLLHPYRPRFSLSASRQLLGFSIWVFCNNVLLFIRTRSADFIIGRVLGARSLGFFNIGYEISNLPSSELIAPINQAVLPGYSVVMSDKQSRRSAYLQVLGMIAMAVLPASMGIAAVSELLVPVLLGPQWLATIPLIQILAISGGVNALQSNTGAAYIAMGKPQINVFMQAVVLVVLAPTAIVLTSRTGLIGTAYAYLFSALVMLSLNIPTAIRVIDVSATEMIARVIRPLAASLTMLVAVRWLLTQFASTAEAPAMIIQLFFSITAGALTYGLAVLLLWLAVGRPDGAERYILERFVRIPMLRRLTY